MREKNVIIFIFAVDRKHVICDIKTMRDQQGHTDELDRVQDTKSASRFSLYELKAMSKQGDIGGFWRIIFPVQKLGRGDAAPSERPGMQFEGTVGVEL